MGLLERLRSLLVGWAGGSDSAAGPASGSAPWHDPEGRGRIIHQHYEEIAEDQAHEIATILMDHADEHGNIQRSPVTEDINERLDLADDLVEDIVLTETASISIIDRIEELRSRPDSEDFTYSLVGPSDEQTHPVLEDARDEIEDRGGGVPLEELREILRDQAAKHQDEGGTPERVDHWVAYQKPRYTITRHGE